MRRRELLLMATAMMAAPRSLRAQQKAMPVIGWLSSASSGQIDAYLAAFRQGLAETGYVEGQTYQSNTGGRRTITIGCPALRCSSSAARSM